MPSEDERRTDKVVDAIEQVAQELRSSIEELRMLLMTEREDQRDR